MADDRSWEDALIADMRAHDGAVTQGPLAGHPLMIATSTGAKTGKRRQAILTYTRDAGDFVVAGTAGGSPTTPSWVRNMAAHPDVTIETGNRTIQAEAALVDGPERDRLWTQHVEQLPWFAEYPKKAGRVIPIVRLKPRTAA